MKKNWQKVNNRMILRDSSSETPYLEKKVYSLEHDAKIGLYLKEMFDSFKFDFKLYGLETAFINRVVNTYNHTKGNLGIVMNGTQGTGKTITAEEICNRLGLPVILINTKYNDMVSWMSDIHEDVVIFIDEYEKVFKGSIGDGSYNDDGEQTPNDSTLLGIMDGTYKTEFRKVFLLTTNRMWLNENLLNRPGRLRFKKEFGDLNLEQINEIMDDCLKYKEYRDDIITFLKPLKLITVDIVKAVIGQVNIDNEPPAICCENLNVEKKDQEYDIFQVTSKTEELLDKFVSGSQINPAITPGTRWKGNCIYVAGTHYYFTKKPDYKKGICVVKENQEGADITIKIKKTASVHRAFVM